MSGGARPQRSGGCSPHDRYMRPCPQYQPSLGLRAADLADLQGLGNTPATGLDHGPSLGRAQWPSCVTTLATSLSCPRSPSRRSPRPSRRTPAQSSGQHRVLVSLISRPWPGAAHAAVSVAPSTPMCRHAPITSARGGLLSCYRDRGLKTEAGLGDFAKRTRTHELFLTENRL